MSLIGPDGNQLSAASFAPGRLGPTQQTDGPTQVCYFEFDFPDVPEVATYRLGYPNGQVSALTWSLRELREDGWKMYMNWSSR